MMLRIKSAIVLILACSILLSCQYPLDINPDIISSYRKKDRERVSEFLVYFIATSIQPSSSANQQLYSMRDDGQEVKQITHNGAHQIWDAAVSWDGKRIAFLSGSTYDSLFIMNSDGTNIHFVTQQAGHPVWSRDGGRIAFTREVGPDAIGEYLIFTVNVETGVETEAPELPRPRFVTDWSKDSQDLLVWVEDVSYDSIGRLNSFVRVAIDDFTGHEVKTGGSRDMTSLNQSIRHPGIRSHLSAIWTSGDTRR